MVGWSIAGTPRLAVKLSYKQGRRVVVTTIVRSLRHVFSDEMTANNPLLRGRGLCDEVSRFTYVDVGKRRGTFDVKHAAARVSERKVLGAEDSPTPRGQP
jgi:hypothetical protein